MPQTYTVKSGDTLGRIARQYHTTVAALAKANAIANVNVIRVGQRLAVPDGFTPAPPPPPVAPAHPGPNVAAGAARIAEYARAHDVGAPVDNGGGVAAHDWHGVTVQDFAGGGETENRSRCLVADGPNGPHLVRNDFYRNYLANGTHLKLGAPLDDEHLEGGVVVQHFERGAMTWDASRGTRVSVSGQPAPQPQPAPAPQPTPAPAPVTGPGPAGAPGSVYAPYQVAPGASVNGRLGVHWFSNQYDNDLGRAQAVIDRMKSMGVGYCTLLADPGNVQANAALIQKLQANGITPVVRLYTGTPPDQWSDADLATMARGAKDLANLGVKLIQVGNEPNIEGNLKGRGMLTPQGWQQYLDVSTRRQAEAMLAVKRAVGDAAQVGIPPMACGSPDKVDWGSYAPETYFVKLLGAIKDVERASGQRIADWIPTHTYTSGNPGDPHSPDTARGHLAWGPDAGRWYEAQVARVLGRNLKSLSTEGGAEPNAFRGDPGLVDAQMRDGMGQLQNDKNLTNCLWLLYDDAGMSRGEWGAWNKFALWDDPKNWAGGLDAYRQAFAHR